MSHPPPRRCTDKRHENRDGQVLAFASAPTNATAIAAASSGSPPPQRRTTKAAANANASSLSPLPTHLRTEKRRSRHAGQVLAPPQRIEEQRGNCGGEVLAPASAPTNAAARAAARSLPVPPSAARTSTAANAGATSLSPPPRADICYSNRGGQALVPHPPVLHRQALPQWRRPGPGAPP